MSITKENVVVTCGSRLVFDETEAKAWHLLPQLFAKFKDSHKMNIPILQQAFTHAIMVLLTS
jgi:hypothetical protein